MEYNFNVIINNKIGILTISSYLFQLKYDQIRIRDSEPNIIFINETNMLYKFSDREYNIVFCDEKNFKIKEYINL